MRLHRRRLAASPSSHSPDGCENLTAPPPRLFPRGNSLEKHCPERRWRSRHLRTETTRFATRNSSNLGNVVGKTRLHAKFPTEKGVSKWLHPSLLVPMNIEIRRRRVWSRPRMTSEQ